MTTYLTAPNAIRYEIHDAPPDRRPRVHPASPRRGGNRSGPGTSRRLSRILVATDGTAASEGAVIVAGLLARRHQATVDAVSVLPRWGQPPPENEFLAITGELLNERLAAVIPQGQRALGNAARSWAIRVIDSSSTVDSIAEIARAEGHDLIVTGNRRSWVTRWFRRPTALGVSQRSNVPVLVVPQSVSTLPARAVVGVEGTDFDLATAATTVNVLAEDAAVHLVHVDSTDAVVERETEGAESSAGWAVRFADLERAIANSDIASVNSVVLRGGKPAARLVGYAKGVNADLVVAATRPPATIAERVSLGVGGQILRAADRCVLLCASDARRPAGS